MSGKFYRLQEKWGHIEEPPKSMIMFEEGLTILNQEIWSKIPRTGITAYLASCYGEDICIYRPLGCTKGNSIWVTSQVARASIGAIEAIYRVEQIVGRVRQVRGHMADRSTQPYGIARATGTAFPCFVPPGDHATESSLLFTSGHFMTTCKISSSCVSVTRRLFRSESSLPYPPINVLTDFGRIGFPNRRQ